MKKASLNKIFKFGVGGALFAASFSLFGSALSISQIRSETFLECVELENNRFDLTFTHSVSLTPVIDKYVIVTKDEKLSILQTAEHFIAHGQGLPSLVNEPDASSFVNENGTFVLTLNRTIPDLIVQTDKRFKNRLITGEKTINLNKWSDMGLHIIPMQSCESGMKTVIKP